MKRKALVVVLGELARSPRMQYHCISLANYNYDVTVIATGGQDKSCEELESNQNIKQNLMPEVVNLKRYLPGILAYIVRPIWQAFLLIYYLCLVSIPNVIVVQNPPSIPTLPVLWMYSRLLGSKIIVDWHNYGFSILKLSLGQSHPFVRISQFIEFFFGSMADAGFCVSETMQKDLIETYNITYQVRVLYDRPPEHFKPLNLREKHEFYLRIKEEISAFQSIEDKIEMQQNSYPLKSFESRETRFTTSDINNERAIKLKPNRPAIILSSTSWTEDEDFDILLNALRRYDLTIADQLNFLPDTSILNQKQLPQLVCVITGKGPRKEHYLEKINDLNFQHVELVLPWLSASDYPKMVGSSDLGICLHSSSSGTDLPMKVVDMFGCGVPVLAYEYPAIKELVIEDFYGLTFTDSDDLYNKLVTLLEQFYVNNGYCRDDVDCSHLAKYKKNIIRRFLLSRWGPNWSLHAKYIFDTLSTSS